jgi:hypothetical protein
MVNVIADGAFGISDTVPMDKHMLSLRITHPNKNQIPFARLRFAVMFQRRNSR